MKKITYFLSYFVLIALNHFKNKKLKLQIKKNQALADEKARLEEQLKQISQTAKKYRIPFRDVLRYGLYRSKQHGTFLHYRDILYVTSKGAKRNKVFFSLKNQDPYEERATISHLVQKLDARVFIRVSRFYIVNVLEVDLFNGGNLKMKNGQLIAVSGIYTANLEAMLDKLIGRISARESVVSAPSYKNG